MPVRQVDARLVVPALPPRHISRARLLAELDRAAGKPLILVAAGPGAGKTVLLSDWVTHSRAPVAWITVTAADAAPARFWRLLWQALRADGKPGPDLPALMPRDGAVERVQALLAGLPTSSPPPVLIIDDAHFMTHPDVLADLDTLVRLGSPPRVRLVLAARCDPLLPLHRYRLAGQVTELRAKDLAMTRAETRELLAAHGVTLSEEDLDLLVGRTEGWAAGTRLSAMRMEDADHPALFVSELALGQGSIGEYLMAEVLDHQPEPVRRLLMETSLFDEVTGPLADAVTGMRGCADILADLADSNSFVVPVDAARTRFRYHQLFGEILRHSLHRQTGSQVPDLIRRAAAHFQDSGNFGKALYWAARADDWPYAASLLIHGGLAHAFVHREDISGFGALQWRVPAPGDSGTSQAGESAVAAFAIAAVTADGETAAREAQKLHEPAKARPASPELTVTADLARLILGMKAGDGELVAAAAEHLLAQDTGIPGRGAPGMPAAVMLAQAGTAFWHGEVDEANGLLRAALAAAARDGLPVVELDVLAMTALADRLQGRPHHAEDAAHRAYALLRRHSGLSVPPALELAAATGLLMAADLAGAAGALERTQIPDSLGCDPGLAAARRIGQATVLLADGNVKQAQAISRGMSPPAAQPLLMALRQTLVADAETMLGRPGAALEILRGYGHDGIAILAALPRARAHLSLHDLRNAQKCVRAVLTGTSPLISRYTHVEAMLCDARIALAEGDTGRALEMVTAAIELAQDDVVLPFFAAESVFAALLARHPAVAAEWPRPAASGPVTVMADGGPAPTADLCDPLTEREQTVLRFLATNLSNTEIADEMCLSANTVKTHLSAIYRKLTVGRRKDAVLRARELELL
jgi:LuxR family transcriptional regulator, maltose regulon positive regulatory protein